MRTTWSVITRAPRSRVPQAALEAVHGPVVGLVVVAEHVQEAVQGQNVELLQEGSPQATRVSAGGLDADHHVAEPRLSAVAGKDSTSAGRSSPR